ncbi:GNAT family N-acetyltransferase [Nocardioides sp. zg-1228]|uniref:GNAT family N-acetyltransferase n=1 Tax=Nocardioides sp. zg-1228 TaxID=2763008 RepID=UPI00164303DF|nr:GNAT family N-acetyltransferase [Nocardioides sp. zg-1228]MBC2935175.1 GNAT family N-acetyltransferase [Nocardioides sp. zg-1228]QSF58284.1 GNAT family N-acetyltransferase [Nocardioides sp. zg-1228]
MSERYGRRVVAPASQHQTLPSLSTDRLVLRPVELGDLDLMVALNSDPAVMTYIRGRGATPDETAAEWRQRLDHQSDAARGLGYWAGFHAGVFVGWWSASSFEGRPEISGIGYRLRASGWGRGLASEGATVMIRQAFACRDIDRVFASTMAANAGSRRVLEKLGMTKYASGAVSQDRQEIPGWEHGEVAYELTRAKWSRPTLDRN